MLPGTSGRTRDHEYGSMLLLQKNADNLGYKHNHEHDHISQCLKCVMRREGKGEMGREKNIGIKSFKGKRKLTPPPSKETLGFFSPSIEKW